MKHGYLVPVILLVLLAGCLAPGGGGPTPTPTPVVTYTVQQLKYILLDNYNESRFFYCDPDYYPVGRGDELDRAIATFPVIENETDVFAAIATRKGFRPPYSNDTILVIYREYKMLNAIPLVPVSANTYTFSLRLGTEGQGRLVTGIIRSDGVIESERSETAVLTCPICLAGDTLIDTPRGPVPVKDIRAGMTVWTLQKDGTRIAEPVILTVKMPVPASHHLVRIRLADGRGLEASPGHPAADGRPLGTMKAGDELDGALVIGADPVPSPDGYTYDIFPSGDSGVYWAEGIPLKSTLFSLHPDPGVKAEISDPVPKQTGSIFEGGDAGCDLSGSVSEKTSSGIGDEYRYVSALSARGCLLSRI